LRGAGISTGRLARAALLAVLCAGVCAGVSAQSAQPAREKLGAKPRPEDTDKTITSVSLTTSLNAPALGEVVDLSATVAAPPNSATPTGSVTFYSTPHPLTLSVAASSPQVGVYQGWATDGTYIYSIDTASFNKLNNDETWSIVTSNTSPFAGLTPGITHLGDGEYYNGNLYIPAENWAYAGNCTYRYQTIAVYDTTASGLPLVTSNDISADGHEVSGIAVVPSQNALYISSFCDGSKLWIYDLSTLTLTGTLPLSENIESIQGISYNAPTNSFFMTADAFNPAGQQYGGEVYQVSLTGTVTPVFVVPGPGELEGLDFTQTNPGYAINGQLFFLDGGPVALGTEALDGGAATLTTGSIPTGQSQVTATYSGDTTYAPGTSNAVAETIVRLTPNITATASSTSITTAQTLSVGVTVTAASGGPAPTGSVIARCGSYSSAATALSSGAATITVPAWSLASGNDTLTATYVADTASAPTYNSVSASVTVAVAAVTPTVTVTVASNSITAVQTLGVKIAVGAGSGAPAATGTVILVSGSYTTSAMQLSGGNASVTVPAEILPLGSDTLTASYTPAPPSAGLYNTAAGANTVTVTLATPAVNLAASAGTINQTQGVTVTVEVTDGTGNPMPTGSVTLTSGSYSSAATALSGGSAAIAIPPGGLPLGSDSLKVTYLPDTASGGLYQSASQSISVHEIQAVASTVTVTPSAGTITNDEALNVIVAVSGGSGAQTPTGVVTLSSGSYSTQLTLAAGAATFVVPAGTLSSGSNTVTAAYSGDVNYNPSSGKTTVSVATLALSITKASSVSPGSSTSATATLYAGNTFTGTIDLSCALTSAPAGAQSLPTCSLKPASIAFQDGGSTTVTVTMDTTGASSNASNNALLGSYPKRLWPLGDGGALVAAVVLLGLPGRRRRTLWMLALLVAAVAIGASGCGGGGSAGTGGSGPSGTTPGNYVFTVSGMATDSSQTSVSSTVTITVQ